MNHSHLSLFSLKVIRRNLHIKEIHKHKIYSYNNVNTLGLWPTSCVRETTLFLRLFELLENGEDVFVSQISKKDTKRREGLGINSMFH